MVARMSGANSLSEFSSLRFLALTTLTSGICILILSGCEDPNRSEPRGTAPPPIQRQQGYGQSAQSMKAKQAEFLNKIRQADPSYRTIQKAVINENNELGLIL